MKNDRIIIFDTTLRDGEQCPGASMNLREKLEVARQLARLRVDVIEAGFPVISAGDFDSVQRIAREIKGPIICGLARCVPKDIDAAGDALKPAGLRYAVAPIPSADATRPGDAYAFADLRSIAIFSTTKHADAAARFVAYLTSPEADRLLIEEASQLPYRRGLASDARFTASLARTPTLPRASSRAIRSEEE